MTATLTQPLVHRPSMDHVSSFDRSRPSSVAAFSSSSYERAPSPATSNVPRSRTNSATSSPVPSPFAAPSPFQQPFATPNYYPQYPMHQQGWGTTAATPGSYFTPSFHGAFPSGAAPPVFQQPGYQGGPPDFSAWAHVYQQMVAGGHMPAPGRMPAPQMQHQELDDASSGDTARRRTSSAPRSAAASPTNSKGPQPPSTFHPYQRTQKHRSNGSRDRTDMPRSVSTPSTPISLDGLAKVPAVARGGSPANEHRRTASEASFVPPPKLRDDGRPASVHSRTSSRSRESNGQRGSPIVQPAAMPPRTSSPASASLDTTTPTTSTVKSGNRAAPLAPSDPAGANANTATTSPPPRPSPLSQATPLIQPVVEKDRKSMMARFRKEKSHQKTPSVSQPSPVRGEVPGPSRGPSQGTSPKPDAPFINVQAMGSDVSLAETQRTTATNASVAGAKPKGRSLFRMRNKSSDNISLSSTVSSASMMIRKMGSIGKLARRNSLMGISKMFKEKPKDEDEALPEKQGMLGFRKKNNKKAEAAPASISRAHAEVDRIGDDDVVIGLSPAAQLARQHTARSKAEAAKRAEESRRRNAAAPVTIPEMGGTSGEPTWDSNTTSRTTRTVAAAGADAAAASTMPNGTSIVHVVPRGPTVVQAVPFTDAEYDSGSSDGETVEDISATLNQTTLQDDDFQPLWTQAHVDYNARPKKGILKITQSNEELENQSLRQRSASTSEAVGPQVAGPLSALPAPTPEKIDGVAHAPHSHPEDAVERLEDQVEDKSYDPLSPDFSPFDFKPIELDIKSNIYNRPTHNTSEPSLPHLAQRVPQTRSMTAPVRRRLIWAPECAVYSTYDASTYDRRSEPATCNRLTPELAMAIKQELNEFKLEMPVHPSSRIYTHYFA